jgi:methyl-accepting chemotaxis protein
VAEIAAASAEQARGLEEVNGAVVNMDEMTQRNGALVEQTNASAQAMANQARQLAELVGHFRFEGTVAANDRLAQAEVDTLEAGEAGNGETGDDGDAAKDAAD